MAKCRTSDLNSGAIKIHTDTKDDVNKKFRANKLEGEVIVDHLGQVYICPQLSTTKWKFYPKSSQLIVRQDQRWNTVIEETLQFMEAHYSVSVEDRKPSWINISQPFRCPKMALYIKSLDFIA
ncbi:hypothetical protein [Vibrio mediterranei]|uniref:hypothetical protein n=1 Tax=Vibrio mediterranei TaxID=689 RepID=UPI004067B0C1